MHEEGIVFPQDKVEALKYYLLERSLVRPVKGIDQQIAQARSRLTPEQQDEADKRFREELQSRKAAQRKAKVENGGVAYDAHLNLFPSIY